MQLKEFNPTTVGVSRRSGTYISLNNKSGLVYINENAISALQLKGGTDVQFLQDENEPAIWYLEIVKKGGFKLRLPKPSSKGVKGLFFNNTSLCRSIFDSVNFTGNYGRILIGESVTFQKRNLITLITASLRNK